MSASGNRDVTVNLDGLWMLQGLLDIRHLAPELRCRPYVSADSPGGWSAHPGMAAMRDSGVVAGDTVIEPLAGRMRVLAAPDLEVVAVFSAGKLALGRDDGGEHSATGSIPGNELRVVLSRRADHWVSAVRVGGDITIDDAPISGVDSIADLILKILDTIHCADPAQITPVNVPMSEIAQATEAWGESDFDVFGAGALRQLGLSPATVVALGQALANPVAEASVYARQYRDDQQAPSASVLSLKDGNQGRLALYQQGRTVGSNEDWLAICPATEQLVRLGVKTVLESLPFGAWDSHRRI